ncbi:RNase H type-1 domain-containing protein OS=Streptomyces antimycoticus OX=68175 GN=SSPO_069470 PE=4 SV=1 [Streptomyces antimycoticus]
MDAGKRGEQWQPKVPPGGTPAAGAPEAAAPADDALAEPAATGAPAVGWGAADLGTPATFVLLRHGETPLTPEKRFSGSGGTDPGLSDVGRHQAERVAAALAARGTIQAIVTSPLRRCRETAEAVARRLGLDVRVEEGLRETDFGAWEGLTFAEVKERHPDDLEAWLASSKVARPAAARASRRSRAGSRFSRDKLIARLYGPYGAAGRPGCRTDQNPGQAGPGSPAGDLVPHGQLSVASLSAVAYYADGNASLRLLNETAHLR